MIFESVEHLESYYDRLNIVNFDGAGNPIYQYPKCSMIWYRMDQYGRQKDGGVTLEKQVPGFRTTDVEGRDSLDTEIDEIEYAHVNGARYRSRKTLSRDITVNYKLVSFDVDDHRKRLNKLRSILFGSVGEESVIVFRDEPDKFYVGTVKTFEEAKFVRNFASEGKIVIHCSDPYKYSTKVYTAKPEKDSSGRYVFTIDYNGSYFSSPKFVARHTKAENGYLSFTDEFSHIIQVGNPNEKDGEYTKKNALTLVNVDFGVDDIYSNGKGWWGNIFTAPTNHGSKPIFAEGSFYTYKTAFTRGANSDMPDGSGVWLKATKPISENKWHGPSFFKGFVNSAKAPLHETSNPVKHFRADFDYVLAKQTNGKENMMAGFEFIIFGVDADWKKKDGGSYPGWYENLSKLTPGIKRFINPTVKKADGTKGTFRSAPMVRVCVWNVNPNTADGRVWIQANNQHKETIDFSAKLPMPLQAIKQQKNGWVEWTPGKWSYYKDGKWLRGWQQLKDTDGTFWFYFDLNGYALSGWHNLKWSKSGDTKDRFYFNSRCEMLTGTHTIDGTTYTFDKNGVLQTGTPSTVGWKGSGYMWRYYKKNSSNKLYYVTGWNKIDGKWYYMDVSGYTVHGWQKLKWNNGKNTDTFYFNSSCAMVTGSQKINGKVYTFDKNGCLTTGNAPNLSTSSLPVENTAQNGTSSPTDPYYKMKMSRVTIEVFRQKLTVTVNGKTYTYANAFGSNVVFTGVGLQEYVYKNHNPITYTQSMINAGKPIGVMYLDKLNIVQLNSEWSDTKNSLPKGSTVTVDCKDGYIYLNDERTPALGALGNDYETMLLQPFYLRNAAQRFQVNYSSWVKDGEEPELEMQYREVFI